MKSREPLTLALVAAVALATGCSSYVGGAPPGQDSGEDDDGFDGPGDLGDDDDGSDDGDDLPGDGGEDEPDDPDPDPPGNPEEPLDQGTNVSGWTVGMAVTEVCTTSAVAGLAEQLIAEIACVQPDTIARIDGISGVTLASGMRPYLQKSAVTALKSVAATQPLQLNSGLRALPQQYLLYEWYRRGLCSATLAATPGKSQHESGLAIDAQNASTAKAALLAKGWTWGGSGDPMHFNYGSGTDLRSIGVRAFQRLHNLNHPSDTILVDGIYGPMTGGAVSDAPAKGFATRSTCSAARSVDTSVSWTSAGDDRIHVRATAPAAAREVEVWVGGTLVGVIERGDAAAGAPLEAVVEVAPGVTPGGRQLVEAVARDADGALVGRGLALDYVRGPAAAAPIADELAR
jgi:hypothetical protein